MDHPASDIGGDGRSPWRVTILEEAASTNDVVKEMFQDPAIRLPIAVRALRQTAGRGRGSNAWYSDEGSLTFTVGIDPASFGITRSELSKISLTTALAVMDALDGLVPASCLRLRWPNDVEAFGRKLAGILPECVETGRGPRLAIGVGINVTTRFDQAPAAVAAMATSVQRLMGGELPETGQDEILDRFTARLENLLARLGQNDPALAARWSSADDLFGRPIRVDLGGETRDAVACGITECGGLRVSIGGEFRTLYGGRVLRDDHPRSDRSAKTIAP